MFQDRFSGLAIHGLAMNANVVFSRMQMESVLPDSITFIGILTACSHCGFVEEGHKYFGMMQNRFMIQPQLKHYGTVVDLLGRAGLMEDVIWRALLSACRIHRKKELGESAGRFGGFTPLTDLVLVDVSEEEIEENLTFHSEKLVLAYAVLKPAYLSRLS
ncbi:hypothetical protein JHK85_043036 [Glycine max]|nr:hypothetical protein JHK85_043036 [Glycine max]